MNNPHSRHPQLKRFARITGLIALDGLMLGILLWGSFALGYEVPGPTAVKIALIAIWVAIGSAAIFLIWKHQHRWRALSALALAALSLLLWWGTLKPSHDRQWADDVARLLHAEVNGNHVALSNVRNFDWRSESDYTPRWEAREYDLDRLVSADMFLSYWMGPTIAHTLISFGFDDGRYLVFSLEIRKERDEKFSAIGGFFRQFESVLIAAEESDIVRTRTNARGEDVHLYRLGLSKTALSALFLSYLDEAQKIEATPRFYNTLTSNCTTVVYQLARRIDPGLPFDFRLIASGYLAGYVQDLGVLAAGYRLEQLAELGHINQRALDADQQHADFSRAIRRGVPTPNSTITH